MSNRILQEMKGGIPIDAGSNVIGKVKTLGAESSVTMTRPNDTTQYAVGDVIGSSPAAVLTFDNVSSVAGSDFIIVGVNLEIDIDAAASGMGVCRLHLYKSAPTPIADNAVFNLPAADRSKYIGYVDIDAPQDIGDTLWTNMDGLVVKRRLASNSTSIYGMLETRTIFTPSASTVRKITLNVLEV